MGYATKADYDPRVIPETYSMLKRVGERQGSQLPGFLSTHPDPGNREIRNSQLAQAAVAGGRRDLRIDAPRYRAHIEPELRPVLPGVVEVGSALAVWFAKCPAWLSRRRLRRSSW